MRNAVRRPILAVASVLAMLIGASPALAVTEVKLQHFFGACEAEFGTNTDIRKATGECGILTSLINEFNAENPDTHVSVTTVEWPGYDQLTAQFAAGDPPDIISIHLSAISDYQSNGLLLPLDAMLADKGIHAEDFTPAAREGVTKEGQLYGLPMDNWTILFHVNLDLFRQAGLLNPDGTPKLPTSVDELLEQARLFKEKTGKPYFVQPLVNNNASFAAFFYTFLFQQNASLFADPGKAGVDTPEARKVAEMYKAIYDQGDTLKDLDYAASVNAFLAGDAGVNLNGTWVIGDYTAASRTAGTALNKGGYAVYPFPQLFPGRKAQYANGHAWAVSRKDRSAEESAAIAKFLSFFEKNDFEWARTGHLPAVRAVLDQPEFQSLPHRDTLAPIAALGTALPSTVQRQFAIQDIVGQELGAAVTGQKEIGAALSDMEARIDEMLANL
ncbi:hypothetical protein GCM10011390_33910 [Aureimonas endophytica]|uniref:Carbohydrate ABC transporter substrate-binding protein (CUT1 family) n=1 Tax=Aureimonas endophytica TaxID=2027858 RepID=A0A917E8T4_9HYPH|nr:extracellular solute-binding protein [Aureimonas endophytica]GGE11971.1 hypothetical protein GCM10011390_33910 [Aureimonas endophytica]